MSTSDGNAVTVPPSVPPRRRSYLVRTITALVVAPPVLGAVVIGGVAMDLLVALAAAITGREAVRVAWPERSQLLAAGLALLLAGATLCAAMARFDVGVVVLCGLAVAVIFGSRTLRGPFLALALLYIGVGCFGFLWLRAVPDVGLGLALLVIGAVWATDVGALFAGQWIGGPRLLPLLSPNKTWAGLVGGMFSAGVISAALAIGLPAAGAPIWPGSWPTVVGAGLALALAAQLGDLLQSGYKRYFGVKDTGRIMPGHGGLLDRVDGLLAAASVLALAVLATQGVA